MKFDWLQADELSTLFHLHLSGGDGNPLPDKDYETLKREVVDSGIRELDATQWNYTNFGGPLFSRCTCLQFADLHSQKLQIIDVEAFRGCRSLSWVCLPPNLVEIKDRAFKNCFALHLTKIPDTCEFIGEDALAGCWNIDELSVPESCYVVGEEAPDKNYDCAYLNIGERYTDTSGVKKPVYIKLVYRKKEK